jgi:thymidylate synthase (FAD)
MKVKLLKFTQDSEKMCAVAARLCYSPAGVDEISQKFTNKEIKRLLGKVISSGHYSVLEHASFTFGIEDVSRVLLAQLTRHRIASFSVQSQRYVELKDAIKFIVPSTIKRNKVLSKKYSNLLKSAEVLYKEFLEAGIPAEDARYVLSSSFVTKVIITMNARELRHFFLVRCCNRAQWELRDMACRMLSVVKKAAPLLFLGAGPNCVRNDCREFLSCGKPWIGSSNK